MELELEHVRKVVEEIKKRTAAPAYSLVINPDKKPDIFDSKFGGLPYWDKTKKYPKDSEGNSLILLAQINFDKIQAEKPLPDKGMLQFFIRPDDVFGIDFDNQDKQDTFRVVYHETVDYDISREEIERFDVPDSSLEEFEECTPVMMEVAVECVKNTSYMRFCDYQFEQTFKDIVKELFDFDLGEKSIYDAVGYDVMEEVEEDEQDSEESEGGHWLLGHPYFTQTDPREYNKEYRVYDTLLFQMDSDYEGQEDLVLWGDCGVGNFFINREDLEKKDFSKVLYNWDCC